MAVRMRRRPVMAGDATGNGDSQPATAWCMRAFVQRAKAAKEESGEGARDGEKESADLTNVINLDGCSNGDGVRVIFSSSQSPFAVLLLLPKLRLPTSLLQLFQLPESLLLPALSRQAPLPHSHLLGFISSRATLPVVISIGSSTDQVGVGLQVPFRWRRRRRRRRIELWGNCGEIRSRRFGGRHCVGFRRDRPPCRSNSPPPLCSLVHLRFVRQKEGLLGFVRDGFLQGMICGGCAASVKRILETLPQIYSATVNLEKQTAFIWAASEAKVTED